MTNRAYYVWSGNIRFKIHARTEWEAALLVFQRLGSDENTGQIFVADPDYVCINQRGFESAPDARYDINRILKAAGYVK